MIRNIVSLLLLTVLPFAICANGVSENHPKYLLFQTMDRNSKFTQTNPLGLIKMSPSVNHFLVEISSSERTIVLTFIVLKFLSGLLYRILIFCNVYKTGLLTPCNFMTGLLRAHENNNLSDIKCELYDMTLKV